MVDGRVLGVDAILIVASAAVEDGFETASWEGTVWNSIAIDVAVATEILDGVELFLASYYLTAVERLVRVLEAGGHPAIHAEVKVGEAEDKSLVALGHIESAPAEFEALVDCSWNEDDVLSVAVTGFIQQAKVTLLGSCRQTGGWPNAIDIPDDSGNLCEIREADEF